MSTISGVRASVLNLCLGCEPCNTKKRIQDIRDFLAQKPDLLAQILSQVKRPLADISKTCYRCGHSQDMPLHQRTYRCPFCSLVIDRDSNSARNILLRYLARLEPHKLLSGKRCTWVKPSNRHVYTRLERQEDR
jgi:hypothetical protein